MELERKLGVWKNEGFIDQSMVEQILTFEKQQPKPTKLPLLLIIGLIFFSLAIFSFIAANWQVMPALLKIGLFVLLMWMFYGFGYFSERRNLGSPIIFRLLGLVMFGASILVTVQSFHFTVSNSMLPWAIFITALAHYFYWRQFPFALVTFISGIFVLMTSIPSIGWFEWGCFIAVTVVWFYFSHSNSSMIFSWLLLFGSGLMLWTLIDYESFLWPIWTLFTLVLLLLVVPEKERLLGPLYLIFGAIQLVVYLAIRGEMPDSFLNLNLMESVALLVVAVSVFVLTYLRFRSISWMAVLGAVGLLFYDDTAIGLAILAEVVALAYLVISNRQDKSLTLGFVYFIAVQFVLYFVYAWDRLDMSLFFLLGAILLFVLSGIAWYVNRKKAGVAS